MPRHPIFFRFLQILFLFASNIAFTYTAYVTDFGAQAVFIIDTVTQSVVSTVSTGEFPSFSAPNQIVLSPDGNFAYVGDGGNSLLYIIDTNENSVTKNTAVGVISFPSSEDTTSIAITPDGTLVYLGAEIYSSIYCFDTTSRTLIGAVMGIPPDAFLLSMAVHPTEQYAYATDVGNNVVYAIDTDPLSGTFNTILMEGTFDAPVPTSIVFTSDGQYAYLAATEEDTGFTVLYGANRSSTNWGQFLGYVAANDPFTPFGLIVALAISPNGQFLYSVDAENLLINTISTETNEVIQQSAVVAVGEPPLVLLAVTPDNGSLYITPADPSIVEVMNTTTYVVTTVNNETMTPFVSPNGIAIKNTQSPSPRPNTVLYDINRLRPIYEEELLKTKEKLSRAEL